MYMYREKTQCIKLYYYNLICIQNTEHDSRKRTLQTLRDGSVGIVFQYIEGAIECVLHWYGFQVAIPTSTII